MNDIKGKNRTELVKLLLEKRNALQAFRLGNSGSKTKNVKEGKVNRKDIARIMTELNAQKRAEVSAPAEAKVVKVAKVSKKAAKAKK